MIAEGVVLDNNGVPLPGAHVYFVDEDGNEIPSLGGTSTGMDGHFTLDSPDSGHIEASFVGFEYQTISFDEYQAFFTFNLIEDENVIGAATVTTKQAWWKQPKYYAIGAIVLITAYFIYKKYLSNG